MQVAGVQAQVDDVKITMEDNVQNMLKQVNHESNRIEFWQPPRTWHPSSVHCTVLAMRKGEQEGTSHTGRALASQAAALDCHWFRV